MLSLSSYAVANVETQDSIGVAYIGHSDSWDEHDNWTGTYFYEVIIEGESGLSVGRFGITGGAKAEDAQIKWETTSGDQELSVDLKDYYSVLRLMDGKGDRTLIDAYDKLKRKQMSQHHKEKI